MKNNNKLKSAIFGVTLLAIGWMGSARLPQLHKYFLRKVVASQVVMVTNFEATSGGTGFYIMASSGKRVIVTNAHVCELGEKAPIFVGRIRVRPIKVDKEHDLCALVPALPNVLFHSYGLYLRGSGLGIGEIVYAVGHPELLPMTVTEGEYIGEVPIQLPMAASNAPGMCPEGTTEYQVAWFFLCLKSFDAGATTTSILPGNSGSPAVDYLGRVVGVFFAGNEANRGFFVPYRHLKNFLEGI